MKPTFEKVLSEEQRNLKFGIPDKIKLTCAINKMTPQSNQTKAKIKYIKIYERFFLKAPKSLNSVIVKELGTVNTKNGPIPKLNNIVPKGRHNYVIS